MEPSNYVMPFLVLNMGGEMVYILDQRLRAQKIDVEKSKTVLGDVIKTMCNEKFIEQLFKPQAMYTNAATRQVFDRLAHSSIMRLNTSSMDKLYDLMTMGIKLQTMSCASPDMLILVTLKHLTAMKALGAAPAVSELVDAAIKNVLKIYGQFSLGDYHVLRQRILYFFQDRRIKVSLFLQNKAQDMKGALSVVPTGFVATGAKLPGYVICFDHNGREIRSDMIALNSAVDADENLVDNVIHRDLNECRQGDNIYGTARQDDKKAAGTPADLGPVGARSPMGSKGSPNKNRPKVSGSDEMNLLANLMGSGVKATENDKPLKLNLFPDDEESKGDSNRVIQIDGKSDRKTAKNIVDDFDVKGSSDGKKGADDEDDDLLSLMDST